MGSYDGLTPSKVVSFNEQYQMLDDSGHHHNGDSSGVPGRTEHENCTYFTNYSDASGASSSGQVSVFCSLLVSLYNSIKLLPPVT